MKATCECVPVSARSFTDRPFPPLRQPRTRAVFDHVFQVQPASTETSPEADYKLTYFEVRAPLDAPVNSKRNVDAPVDSFGCTRLL
eukprot:scaffold41451_cov28-Tisochrysis_lutea.AAC.4